MKNGIAGEERENAAELILEEQADQEAGHQRAEHAHVLEHLAELRPFADASDFGNLWPKNARP